MSERKQLLAPGPRLPSGILEAGDTDGKMACRAVKDSLTSQVAENSDRPMVLIHDAHQGHPLGGNLQVEKPFDAIREPHGFRSHRRV